MMDHVGRGVELSEARYTVTGDLVLGFTPVCLCQCMDHWLEDRRGGPHISPTGVAIACNYGKPTPVTMARHITAVTSGITPPS